MKTELLDHGFKSSKREVNPTYIDCMGYRVPGLTKQKPGTRAFNPIVQANSLIKFKYLKINMKTAYKSGLQLYRLIAYRTQGKRVELTLLMST